MPVNNTSVASYLEEGCGRCDLFKTPQCKVHAWTSALVELRALLLDSGLTEEMKWGSPCYTLGGKNVVMLASLKDFCALSFFKGALLTDPDDVLDAAGPNVQGARLFKFTSAEQVHEHRTHVVGFLQEAISLEERGATVPRRAAPEPMPDELRVTLDGDPKLRAAFDALTPGRQRSYALHVGGAKQSKTRLSRAERCAAKIFEGKGFNER